MPAPALFTPGKAPAGIFDARDAQTVYNHPPPPVLVGGLIALFLSGVVFMQVALYFQMYQADRKRLKSIVVAVWLLDITHSALVCTANWGNLIVDYGEFQTLDDIQWSISLTIALTALTTVIVHCFFIHRIFKLSRGNYYITIPLIALALLRVGSALVTTAQMLRLRSYVLFIKEYTYIFTLGLTVSASLDILITVTLCYYIRRGNRQGFARISHMIDALTLYTVENGMLTCIATLLSLFFWLFMKHNFVFLGLHLAINKLYANSFLASLNARKSLASRVQGGSHGDRYPVPVMLANVPQTPRSYAPRDKHPLQVTIDVERTVQHDTVMEAGASSTPVEVDLGSVHKSDHDTLDSR